ncbi:hypothetical protein KSP39_PZI008184 [Platanthera zijinensis]|uniref:Reverse transcriptase Ty1/copia-type domain-containing protein n=1 Tax=Platanthera zijinensis TaxID=2320716 RepID=A0AAP0G896_9ASPA
MPLIGDPVVPEPVTEQVEDVEAVLPPIPVEVPPHVQEVHPPARRSIRERRPAISSDYEVYLGESDYDVGHIVDPVTFKIAVSGHQNDLWWDAMKDEMESMRLNKVWELVELPEGCRPIGSKWVFKTKKDSKDKVERFKARLVAKGFTQREGIDYHETFSPVSSKDSFRVIMALVAHYDLGLHQMDVKTTFLNDDLAEEVYMVQPEGFKSGHSEQLVCKLNKSLYGLKQASKQWYLKFDEIVTSFGFEENKVDCCIYLKISGSRFIFLILYVDDILLASSDLALLHECKQFLSKHFDMKDLGEASFVLGIEIIRDRSHYTLSLSQKAYIERILERFSMLGCKHGDVPVLKDDRLSLSQCPKNDIERERMKDIPYASAVGSLMYAQVCTRPDIAFAVGLLGRYQSNPGPNH